MTDPLDTPLARDAHIDVLSHLVLRELQGWEQPRYDSSVTLREATTLLEQEQS